MISSSAHVYQTSFLDPEAFRPERWLVGDKEYNEMEKHIMPIFWRFEYVSGN